ncbi:MAG: branched-chain amino acid ABC transporter permease [Armatimonadota bacterium]|nr:branched-chain amino acid ABC transporter permease [Armatimonadota bacterium]MDR7570230.1 branched-chain amino acid ABC transporter permease [Armatimonadota bacterium]MDR7615574.1 branched-chain amino acid ABC transporter permease [Armatimonadota bacterium]
MELKIPSQLLTSRGPLQAMSFPAALAAFLLLLPVVLPYEALAAQILVYTLFSLGYNLLFGYTGLLSFGHAAFFGMGSYTAGLLAREITANVLWTLPAAIGVGAVGGAVVGFFCLRRRGDYFSLMTLAFGQLLYFIAHQWREVTGGDDGLRGIPVAHVQVGPWAYALESSRDVYVLLALLTFGAFLGFRRLLRSPFGTALQAIRENELRAEAVGYDTFRLKLWAFVLSAAMSSAAGALNVYLLKFAGLNSLHWTTSGYAVLITILGGAGTLLGPLVGALAFVGLQDVLSALPAIVDRWPFFVGLLFIVCVLVFPHGIWGTVEQLQARFRRHAPALGSSEG